MRAPLFGVYFLEVLKTRIMPYWSWRGLGCCLGLCVDLGFYIGVISGSDEDHPDTKAKSRVDLIFYMSSGQYSGWIYGFP